MARRGRVARAPDSRLTLAQRWVDLGETQRAAVAAAVVDLVAEGRTPLKVAELAERAGISRPTFYKYFPTLGAASSTPCRCSSPTSTLTSGSGFGATRQRPRAPRTLSPSGRAGLRPGAARGHPLLHLLRLLLPGRRSLGRRGPPAQRALAPGRLTVRRAFPGVRLRPRGPSTRARHRRRHSAGRLVSSLTGASQRLLIESDRTSGSDALAHGVHDTLIDVWRRALTPEDHR